ncbi:peptide chain release factor N(5)-glutamine methyltransferase [Qipengyuania sp. 1XM1-15A]|uniref:peptide chain release factor N(5)-glutamine methyltransferase n=1 Tax=Qipengyuania xiamenensis TaxID=2867237 RepID=UPI001C866F27|nr:peptide chain release factor N(5)-glutamine methyltransferase [Qipengyuania xiamenensis]MBX7533754.1 peptide chain release factor N(5)-glutamine methyltransferase [Qipengyuania xiamenensis]
MTKATTPTVGDAIRAAAGRLEATSPTARLDAELLMANALGMQRSDMLIRAMQDDAPEGFAALVDRRANCEPVAHILGHQEFYGREFLVTADTLIPRGDSELLVACALESHPAPSRVLDLGTGTGALLLSVLAETSAKGVGTDRSAAALAVAHDNADRLGVEDRTRFYLLDWHKEGWADELGRFDLILCNPPYVEESAKLEPDVRGFEPHGALFAGPEGLDDYRVIIPQLRNLLTYGGSAILEIGHEQSASVSEIAQAAGFSVELRRDLADRPRALILT